VALASFSSARRCPRAPTLCAGSRRLTTPGADLEDGTRPLCHPQDALALAGHSVADEIFAIVFSHLSLRRRRLRAPRRQHVRHSLGHPTQRRGGAISRCSRLVGICLEPRAGHLGQRRGRHIISPRSTSFITERSRAQRVRKLITEMGEPNRRHRIQIKPIPAGLLKDGGMDRHGA
jgi:hypothetical protein